LQTPHQTKTSPTKPKNPHPHQHTTHHNHHNITHTIPGGGKRSKPNVSAQQAESWCLENLAISALGLPTDRPFWLRFDLRTNYRRDLGSVVGDNGVTLSGLIDLFSRKQGAGDISWTRNAGPFRLLELPRTPSGRGRIG
jgi:hypothetical protein